MPKQYIINTFTDRLFSGNPTAVCFFPAAWPSDELLLHIARENVLSHTAFIHPMDGARYELRWFTPTTEIDFCGHPTLAAAFVITNFLTPEAEAVEFHTKGGILLVKKVGDMLEMDFPAYTLKQLEITDDVVDALGARPAELWRARDLLCVFETPEQIRALHPDMDKLRKLKGALMQVTAPGSGEYGCISRTFAPKMGLPEDPVCGSGHCHIIPYWATKTGKTHFIARQASPRGGTLYCRLEGERVILGGQARLYAVCDLMLEEEL